MLRTDENDFLLSIKVKLATLVEDDLKASFSIATTRGVREGATLCPGLLHFTLDPDLIVFRAKQSGIKYHFLVFGMTRVGIGSRSLGPLANTTFIWPMDKLTPLHYLRLVWDVLSLNPSDSAFWYIEVLCNKSDWLSRDFTDYLLEFS